MPQCPADWLQTLEPRRLLSAAAVGGAFVGSTLVVTGQSSRATSITVAVSDDLQQVNVNLQWLIRGVVQSLDQSFDASRVAAVDIRAGAAGDTIQTLALGALDIPANINAGAGNDNIV